jgi:ubiquinone biosynthesis protein COQ9
MLDVTTTKGKIIAAAMRLAGDRPWSEVTLRDIAQAAGVSMADMKREVSSKGHIFGLFTAAVDKEVLAKAGEPDPNQSPRDNLFETIMNRFDVMQPYRAGIKSILAGSIPDPRLAQRLLSSQAWMLEAAGISSYGPVGGLKTIGLSSVYMQVVRVWLDDDDPGMARTMATLDRRLRRGERSIQALDDGCRGVARLLAMFRCRRSQSEGRDTAGNDSMAAAGSGGMPGADTGGAPNPAL